MDYQKLFNYMRDEHGVTLLEQDMQEICNIVNEIQPAEVRQFSVVGRSEQLVCDVCGSNDVIEAPHMGKNCNRCHPL